MTDNPSGSTGQNVTTPPNAPEAGSNGEREALTRIVERAAARRGHGLVVGQCECIVDDLILAGFTRVHHDESMSPTINRVAPGGSRPWTDTEQVRLAAQAMRDADFSTDEFDVYQAINVLAVQRDAAIRERDEARAERDAFKADKLQLCRERDECLCRIDVAVAAAEQAKARANLADHRRDTVECWCCIGSGVISLSAYRADRCPACQGAGRLDLGACRKLVDDEARETQHYKDAFAGSEGDLEQVEKRESALRAECDAAIARAEAAEAKLRGIEEADMGEIRALNASLDASDKRAAALAEALRHALVCRWPADAMFSCAECFAARAALAGNGTGEGA